MKKFKVYLDNCCFNRPYDDQTQERIYLESLAKLYVQQCIVEQRIGFVWSYVLEYENGMNPYTIRKNAIKDFSRHCVQYVDIHDEKEIIRIANETVKPSIRQKDALHIACAIFSESDYLLTTDDKILKFKPDKIKICDPIQFIKEMEADNHE
jgi:predicted nucleic acid-binding protein